MDESFEIYALCLCEKFDFAQLQKQMIESKRCTSYRGALLVEWRQGEIFIFEYGVIVFWNITATEREEFVAVIDDHIQNPLDSIISDEFTYQLNADRCYVKDDHIQLENDETMTRLAISHGIAQSTKLSQFEFQAQHTISETVHIPQNIAVTGESNIKRKELAKLRGRLFLTKSGIMLNYDLLDKPEFFWEYPELDIYYNMISDYLEVMQRVEVLSKKLETISELLEMMADEQKHKHSSLLEWIIIWLIALEIVVFLVHDIFKWL